MLLCLLGAGLIAVPLTVLSGWDLVGATPLIVVGAVLAVLGAFYTRVHGPLVFRGFQIPIDPPPSRSPSLPEAADEDEDPPNRNDVHWMPAAWRWIVGTLLDFVRGGAA